MDVDECKRSPSPCSSGFSCHNSHGSFKCHDIDECLSSPCWEGELCVNTRGAFRCEIPPTSEDSKSKFTKHNVQYRYDFFSSLKRKIFTKIHLFSLETMTTNMIRMTKTPQKRTWSVIINPTHVITQAVVNGSKAHVLNYLYVTKLLFLTLLCVFI